MTNLALRPIHPEECLFVLGLPFEKEAFVASLDDPRTYASQHLDESREPGRAWTRASTFVQLCLREIGKIKELGATVMLSPSIAEWTAAAPGYVVVILFTHAYWTPVDTAHIKDRAGLVKDLLFGASVASASYAAWLDETVLRTLPDPAACTAAARLEALCAACRYAHRWWAAMPGKRPELDPFGIREAVVQNLCRPEIDRHYASYVECDQSIEFSGRMCGVAELFGGLGAAHHPLIFDLGICNSAMMANTVRHVCPGSLTLVNEWQKDPLTAFLRCAAALRELRREPCQYFEAYSRLIP